jgi:replicative DNA helicase
VRTLAQRGEMLERPLPHDADAERALLGSVLLDNSLLDEIAAALTPGDFYVRAHYHVFVAMIALRDSGVEINPFTLKNQLTAEGVFEQAGGLGFISGLSYGLPFGMRPRPLTSIVREKSYLRSLIKLANRLASDALEGEDPPSTIAASFEQALGELRAQAGEQGGAFRTFEEVSREAAAEYEKLARGVTRATPTGYLALDRATRGGVQPGDLWVVAALTGRGKSAWAIGAARQQASLGYPCAIVSREMTDFENFSRAISPLSGVPVWRIEPGLRPDDYDRLMDFCPALGALPIFINSRTPDVFEIRAQVKDLVRRESVRTLYVDYLQLMTAGVETRNATRAQEVATVSRVLKEIAIENGIGVVALAQFNRAAMGAREEKPQIHHLAESSSIEKDASVVIILDMEEQQPNTPERECKMRIAKHRNGPELTLDFIYQGDTLTFRAA